MRVLYISYALWKTTVQSQSFDTYHRVVEGNLRQAWAGNSELVFSTDIEDANFSDWQTNFESGSTEVENEDEALTSILDAGLLVGPPYNPSTGAPIFNIAAGGGTRQYIDRVTSTINVPTGSWTDIFSITGDSVLFEVLLHINTDNMDFRLLVDGDEDVLLDLDELHDDFKLRRDDKRRPGAVMVEYENKLWRYRPMMPQLCPVSLKVQLRSQSGTKKCYRAQLSRGAA